MDIALYYSRMPPILHGEIYYSWYPPSITLPKVTHNHLFASITELVKAVCSFLDTLNATPQLTVSVIGATE